MIDNNGAVMDTQQFAKEYLSGLTGVIDRFDYARFSQIVDRILSAYHRQARIFVMGNGGSATTASHFACDLNKGCCLDLAKKFKMICLNDNLPSLMALANDLDYRSVFEEQLKNFFETGDLVIGISGSGNSENVLRAVRYARENGGVTVGFSGFGGGQLAEVVDTAFVARVDDMQKVEDLHMILVHMIMQAVYRDLHDGNGPAC
jgi:D-sedoheptulose 7-phosphate isomerase